LHRRVSLIALALVLAVAGGLARAGSAGAVQCLVNDSNDAHAADAALGCDSTDGAGKVTLRSALEHFNNTGGNNTVLINLPAPVTITLTLGVISMSTSHNGSSITVIGAGIDKAIIDAHHASQIFDFGGVDSATLQDMTLANASGAPYGAINAKTLNLTRVKLTDPTLAGSGTLVGIVSAGNVTVTGSAIDGATVNGSAGQRITGGLFDTNATAVSDTQITNTSIAVGANGSLHGGVFWPDALTLTRTMITATTVTVGGGATVQGALLNSEGQPITLDHTSIDEVTITTSDTPPFSLEGAVIDNVGEGASTVSLDHSAIGNMTLHAGSTALDGLIRAVEVNLDDSTVANNSVQVGHGARVDAALLDGTVAIDVRYSTIGANQTAGGDLISTRLFSVDNSILANISPNCATTTVFEANHSLDSDGTCKLDPSKGNLSNVNPQLGLFQLNSPGMTKTMELLPGSPAIDAADTSVCPLTDQRDVQRVTPTDTVCDMGAFELHAATPGAQAPGAGQAAGPGAPAVPQTAGPAVPVPATGGA
jgi:hypothetical protein